mmetsp:Transcript_121984/g.345001  ORF Transcript_121984/g.345001 Transcript_121984/m.345001 type:complete len:212 (-) Transcript_121984:10-645(-)
MSWPCWVGRGSKELELPIDECLIGSPVAAKHHCVEGDDVDGARLTALGDEFTVQRVPQRWEIPLCQHVAVSHLRGNVGHAIFPIIVVARQDVEGLFREMLRVHFFEGGAEAWGVLGGRGDAALVKVIPHHQGKVRAKRSGHAHHRLSYNPLVEGCGLLVRLPTPISECDDVEMPPRWGEEGNQKGELYALHGDQSQQIASPAELTALGKMA